MCSPMIPKIFQYNAADFSDLIASNNSFVLTTHINPDGDALGSELGLAEWLMSIGKTVAIYNFSPVPENFYFLDEERPIVKQFDASRDSGAISSADVFMLLDTNDPDRTKSLGTLLQDHKMPVLVDHHLEPKQFAKISFIDTEATSTGEMVYRLIQDMMPKFGGKISPKAAQAMYVAIMTDTGSFKFPRTDSDILRTCADLIDLGADPVKCYNETYNSAKASRLKLIGASLASIKFFFDDKLATQLITQDDLKTAGASPEEVDGFVQFPLQVKSLVFSIFFLQLPNGWKISFRSRGEESSAAEVAKTFGGNGHFNAAGARVYENIPFDDLLKQVCEAVEKQL